MPSEVDPKPRVTKVYTVGDWTAELLIVCIFLGQCVMPRVDRVLDARYPQPVEETPPR